LTAFCGEDTIKTKPLKKQKSIDEEIDKFRLLDQAKISIDQKLDELLELLESSKLDSAAVTEIKSKFNQAVSRVEFSSESLKEFEQLDNVDASRFELADNLELLLSQYEVDSKVTKKFMLVDTLKKVSILIISLLLITLGFGMIIMPAPPYFEMFTIFYFNPNDGVTLMDLIALLIVFTGVYLFITSLVKFKRLEHVS
jgi:hypothetical protein